MARKSNTSQIVDQLTRIEKQADTINEELKNINESIHGLYVVSGKQQISLEEHMRRTEASEKALKILEARSLEAQQLLMDKMLPLERHVAAWAGAGKLVAVLATLAGIAGIIIKVLGL